MKQVISTLLILLITLSVSAQESDWLVKQDKAEEVSEASGNYILLNFSGSDWCGSCMKLDKELFQSDEFHAFANENLVLLNLDFPAKKANKLSDEQTAYNDKLAERYNKQGKFPLTIILDSKGKIIGEMAYPSKSVAEYISSIQSIIE